jgi:hypothetical protein
MMQVNPCTCTFIRHPVPEERAELEAKKILADAVAKDWRYSWSDRQEAKTEAAILYLLLHSECVTAPKIDKKAS